MQLTYDPACNIAYIRLRKKVAKVTTVVVFDELNVDLGPDGRVYGIELLNANEQLGTQRRKHLVVENRDSGKRVELAVWRGEHPRRRQRLASLSGTAAIKLGLQLA